MKLIQLPRGNSYPMTSAQYLRWLNKMRPLPKKIDRDAEPERRIEK